MTFVPYIFTSDGKILIFINITIQFSLSGLWSNTNPFFEKKVFVNPKKQRASQI